MSFTSQEVVDAGKVVLDHYLKHKPVDQIAVERVFLKKLMGNTTEVPAAKEYITETVRHKYDPNFQWFSGSQQVTYNRRVVNEQVSFKWKSAHDGVALDEDRLVQAGIAVADSGPRGLATGAERSILANLLEEQMEALRLGFEAEFSKAVHNSNSSNIDAITGLDGLIGTDFDSGTVGGINKATSGNEWWRPNIIGTGSGNVSNSTYASALAWSSSPTILRGMEWSWRACSRNGGRPNVILVGSLFYDALKYYLLETTFSQVGLDASSEKVLEGGVRKMTFHGVPVEWAPEFADFDALALGGSFPWEQRCYFLNTNYLKLRPMAGQNMITRKPPRPHDRYEYYWGITWRGALTMNRANANALLYCAAS